jgi:telomerase reverse transcriptase
MTLEIYGDYSRYRGNYLRDSLTVVASGVALRQKLKNFAMPKCVALLLDARINRPAIVHLNLYQIFLLCAMKFHCYVHSVSDLQRNQRFLFEAIEDAIDFTNGLVQSRLREANCRTDHVAPRFVSYLGYHAFWRILQRKQSAYPGLMEMLREQLASDKYRWIAACVAPVVDASRTTLFCTGILY